MRRFPLLCILLLVVAQACSDSDGAVAPPVDLSGTVFDYWLTFTPSDSVFGTGGRVRGEGAGWAMSNTGAFVLELRSTAVEGVSFGNARLDIVLTRFPVDSGNVPELGQYAVGPINQADGRAWLRDNSRQWDSNSAGIVILNAWLPGDVLEGQFAVRVLRDVTDPSGQTIEHGASVVGTFTAKLVANHNGSL